LVVGWTLVGEHEGGNVQVFYRGEKSTPVHSIKMQGTQSFQEELRSMRTFDVTDASRCVSGVRHGAGVVDSPALNLMAIMNEHSLYDSWIPLLKVLSCLVRRRFLLLLRLINIGKHHMHYVL
jgi:hypothetical protein